MHSSYKTLRQSVDLQVKAESHSSVSGKMAFG